MGRALVEFLDHKVLPRDLRSRYDAFVRLAEAYKQLNAPVGEFALVTLAASTRALESKTPGDTTYAAIEARLLVLGRERDSLAAQIIAELESLTFGGGTGREGTDTSRTTSQINGVQHLLTLARSLPHS